MNRALDPNVAFSLAKQKTWKNPGNKNINKTIAVSEEAIPLSTPKNDKTTPILGASRPRPPSAIGVE